MHVGRSSVWLCHCSLCYSLAILAELIGVMWKITLFNVLVQSAILPVSFEMLIKIFSTMKEKILETI